jgi:hypothetical protein
MTFLAIAENYFYGTWNKRILVDLGEVGPWVRNSAKEMIFQKIKFDLAADLGLNGVIQEGNYFK